MSHMPVYAAYDAGGTCLYVGQTTDRHPVLRWAEHVRGGAEWTQHAVRWEVLADLTERAATLRLTPTHASPSIANGEPVNYRHDPEIRLAADAVLNKLLDLFQRAIEGRDADGLPDSIDLS